MMFLQESEDGKRGLELEKIFICEMLDVNELKKADSTEFMEQWELKTVHQEGFKGLHGTIRVRNIDNKKYVLTTKIRIENSEGAHETEVLVTKDMFEDFKKLAPMGSKKVRHNFKVKGSHLVWEIDVYYDKNNRPYNWCKVDLELKSPNDVIPPFPIAMKQVINGSERTPREEKLSRQIFIKYFTLFNDVNILPVETRTSR